MSNFFRFFAKRDILATTFTFMILLLGASRLLTIKRDSQPRVDFGKLIITTRYPGASPEDVELNVTNKLEDRIKPIIGVDEIESLSRENISSVEVTIDPNIDDLEEVKQEIRDAVSSVTDFPPEVRDDPAILDLKSTIFPVLEVGISADSTVTYRELREQARLFEKKLKNLPGVSKIDKFGWYAREILVEVDPDKLKDYQLPLGEINRSIIARNIRATAGSFESYTDEKNVVTLQEFEEPQVVGDVIIRSTFEGLRIRVKDVATVSDTFEQASVISRMNGRPAISFLIYKEEGADIIRTVARVRSFAEEYRQELPESMKFDYAYDYSDFIKTSFKVVGTNALLGLVMVVVLLTIFLSFRLSLWVALGIPVSLLGTIFMLPIFGVSLNSITLAAMIIVLGMIVDDAIIISENIASKRQAGLSPLNAAVEGVEEVFLPVLTTIMTTFLAFAPMFFLDGIIGKFVFVVPLTITCALGFSLLESTLAMPAHLAKAWTTCKPRHEKRMHTVWFNPIRDFYERFTRGFLRFRYPILVLFFIALAGSFFYAGKYMDFVLFPKSNADRFDILVQLPSGSSLDATSDKVFKIEKLVQTIPEKYLSSYVSRIGTQSTRESGEKENLAIVEVYLTPPLDRDLSAREIIEMIRKDAQSIEGIDDVNFAIRSTGPPVGKPLNLRVVGIDDSLRTEVTELLIAKMKQLEAISDIDRSDVKGKKQIELKLNHAKMATLGITVADIAQNLRIAYDGEIVTQVRYGEEDVNFRTIISERARKDEDYLLNIAVPNRQGRMIPLREMASINIKSGYSDIMHFDGERVTEITAEVDKAIMPPTQASDTVTAAIDMDQYPGIRVLTGGEAQETSRSVINLASTLLVSIIGIYLLLVILFNSFTQPFLVMIAIPFGFAGVIVAFALNGEPLGFLAVLGLIGLTGVVINDSLVLVDHLNNLRSQKSGNAFDIIAEGTANRLRPIILTTVTTVAGVLPLAYGFGGADPFNAPMALALGWGLIFATPLTLILVPCLYAISVDIADKFGRTKVCEVV